MFCPQCIYVFCVDLRTNSDCFSLYSINLSIFITEAECLLRGTNCVFKSDRYSFVLKRLRLRYVVGILSREVRNSRPGHKLHGGLIKLSLEQSKQWPVRYLNNEVAKHKRRKEQQYGLYHKILPLLYFSNRNE